MMNWFDFFIVAIVVYFALLGWQKGLVRQIIAVVGVVASYLVALRYGNEFIFWLNKLIPVSEWFPQWFTTPTLLGFSLGEIIIRLLGFAIIFAFVGRLFGFVGSVLHGIFSLPILGWVNGLGGLILGIIKGVILSLIVIAVAKMIATPFIAGALEESIIASTVMSVLPVIYEQMKALLLADLH